MSRRVAIVTDSTACLPQEVATDLGIEVVPVSLVFDDGATYRDGVDDLEGLQQRIAVAKRPPATSAPSPGEYLEALRLAAGHVEAILCITVSSSFSTMFDSASRAAEMLGGEYPGKQVRVLDSGNAAMGQGFVALAAARAASDGAALNECVAVAEAMSPRVHLVFALDSLRFLAKGGRVPSAVAWAAGALGIKPLVHYNAGTVSLVERVRSSEKAIRRLAGMVEHYAPDDGGPLHVAVQHAGAPESAENLIRVVETRFHPRSIVTAPFTGAITAHTGPGVFGLAFYRKA